MYSHGPNSLVSFEFDIKVPSYLPRSDTHYYSYFIVKPSTLPAR